MAGLNGKYKYSEAKVKLILEALENGATKKMAAACAGISVDTLSRWIKLNAVFAAKIAYAEATQGLRCLESIKKAALERVETTVKRIEHKDGGVTTITETRTVIDWKAAAWWLSKRYPEEYGNRTRVSPSQPPVTPTAETDSPSAVASAGIGEAQVRALHRKLLAEARRNSDIDRAL